MTTASNVLFFNLETFTIDEIKMCMEYAKKVEPDLNLVYFNEEDFEKFFLTTRDVGRWSDGGPLLLYYYNDYWCSENNWLSNNQIIITDDMGYFVDDGGKTIHDRPKQGVCVKEFLETGKIFFKGCVD